MLLRYITIVFFICFFFVVYIWQNIEVMKIRLTFKNLEKYESRIRWDNNRLRYEIEKLRSIDLIEREADKRNLKKIGKNDFTVIMMEEASKDE